MILALKLVKLIMSWSVVALSTWRIKNVNVFFLILSWFLLWLKLRLFIWMACCRFRRLRFSARERSYIQIKASIILGWSFDQIFFTLLDLCILLSVDLSLTFLLLWYFQWLLFGCLLRFLCIFLCISLFRLLRSRWTSNIFKLTIVDEFTVVFGYNSEKLVRDS